MPQNDDAAFRRLLRDAAGTGEIITVVYDGGSQPGSRRDITVRRVERGRVYANCLASGDAHRPFLVDRMRLADGNEPLFELASFEDGAPAEHTPLPRRTGRIGLIAGTILIFGMAYWLGLGVKFFRWLLSN